MSSFLLFWGQYEGPMWHFLSIAIKKVPNKIVLEKKMFLFFTVNISNTFHKQAHFACKSQILRGTCIMNCYATILKRTSNQSVLNKFDLVFIVMELHWQHRPKLVVHNFAEAPLTAERKYQTWCKGTNFGKKTVSLKQMFHTRITNPTFLKF